MEKRILNLGCGNDMYGTHRIDVFKTPATTDVGDLDKKLPYPDNYFDEIYCKSVLEHIKNLGTFSDECFRILKKGGKVWIRTDYAGFALLHLWKKHEHNKAYEKLFTNQDPFGHKQTEEDNEVEDHHYHLFVASHLRYLFRKFKKHEFNYFYGGSNKLKIFVYKMLPKHTGACHIEMTAWK
ncbi:MAG: methyltransferase domain-containing protein [Nanoarchaeota archaeon]